MAEHSYKMKQKINGNRLTIKNLCPKPMLSSLVTTVFLAESLSIKLLAATPATLLGSL
ncbi:hypothetical protein VC4260B_23580 [Vibrio cholerae 4260B]|nr:hypothetical protein ASZ81_03180 [Vibrio cholerae]EAZ76655.1 hypothetical protein A5E_A0343 [Vibrio cholerae B33]EET91050.1 hypothetical protein VCH_002262 [Vibrio cholerae CIRS101]EEY46772.1 hypothetical protein VIG_003458 [Vibrio cholerae INDRE 91/1]EGR06108.1 hypothetical protein VCHC49A2_1319 [Vibrio cholerae HC-49A2]EGS55544.1 hypothetical protein VCHC40A1_3178 [Vibrio cholerae HC-40A1]EGS55551.1 hypothetical protein VCHC48A1_3160 [Vibrio cholerae HC-48A1]EGS59495.1 hypothetical prot